MIGGVEWSILEMGGGPGEVLLVLPGAMGMADGAGALLGRLADGRRVVAISYPPVGTMTELCDRVAALLDGLGIARADVLGSSLGGWVAQCFVRRHPERVRRLVLSHTYALRPGDERRLRTATRIWRMLPGRLFRALVRRRIRGALEPVRRAGAAADAGSMERILRASADSLDPAALIRYNDWMIESLRAFRFAPGDLAGRAGDVLILESADDPVLRASSRAALRALHPAARVHTFHGGGHATALAMPAEYAAVVTAFLDG
jgi:pimeloyl-ACP methyl ester carboxylesterase